jgi:predicted amidophosphoribosyltransferase
MSASWQQYRIRPAIFVAHQSHPVYGRADKDILLIDDVMTTGATLTSCARTLLDAGAASVSALVFARVV